MSDWFLSPQLNKVLVLFSRSEMNLGGENQYKKHALLGRLLKCSRDVENLPSPSPISITQPHLSLVMGTLFDHSS